MRNNKIVFIIKPSEIQIGSFITKGTKLILLHKIKNPIGKDTANWVIMINDTNGKLNSILKLLFNGLS